MTLPTRKLFLIFSLILGLLSIGLGFCAYTVVFIFLWIPATVMFWLARDQRKSLLWWFTAAINGLAIIRFVYIIIIINSSLIFGNMVIQYHIPEGYTGWLTIQYDVGGMPPLNPSERIYIIKFPENGTFATSSRNIETERHESEYYWYKDGLILAIDKKMLRPESSLVQCEHGNQSVSRFYLLKTPLAPNDPTLLNLCETDLK